MRFSQEFLQVRNLLNWPISMLSMLRKKEVMWISVSTGCGNSTAVMGIGEFLILSKCKMNKLNLDFFSSSK